MEDGRKVSLLFDEAVNKGDWLLVKTDLAVARLTAKEARAIRLTIKEVFDELKNK